MRKKEVPGSLPTQAQSGTLLVLVGAIHTYRPAANLVGVTAPGGLKKKGCFVKSVLERYKNSNCKNLNKNRYYQKNRQVFTGLAN